MVRSNSRGDGVVNRGEGRAHLRGKDRKRISEKEAWKLRSRSSQSGTRAENWKGQLGL